MGRGPLTQIFQIMRIVLYSVIPAVECKHMYMGVVPAYSFYESLVGSVFPGQSWGAFKGATFGARTKGMGPKAITTVGGSTIAGSAEIIGACQIQTIDNADASVDGLVVEKSR